MAIKKFIILIISVFISINSYSQQGKNTEKSKEINEATVTYKRKVPAIKTTEPTPAKPEQALAPTAAEISNANKAIPVKKEAKLDTIIKLGGKKIICNIQKINPNSVSYTKPNETSVQEILRKEIEKILFRNGRKEVYNKPVLTMIDKTQWEAVLVTEKEEDVEGLYKKGVVKANASSGSRSPKAAKLSATIRLQKKTANMGALIVLVTHSEMKGGYGEIPGWELEGIAYSDTPPVDTAIVNKAIRAMLERTRARKGRN
jgi:hypothetical protein